MAALQLQSQYRRRVSKFMYSSIWNWERQLPISPAQSRRFSSDSMDDDWGFSNSEPRSRPPRQRAPSDFREPRRARRLSGEVPDRYPRDNRSQRSSKRSEGSSFRFANDGSMPREGISEPLSQKDFSFLEKFKLNAADNQSGSKEETEQSAPPEGSESVLENQPQPERPPEADEIFKKMKETGLIPNAVAMLDGLCKDGLIQEAMKLFGLIREKATIPEVVIYTAVVEGFCKAEKLDDAIRIFRKMQEKGIAPNAFSYGVLIKGLYKCKRTEEAVGFCIEMLESGHAPNVPTFVGLIDELCRERGVEEAKSVIETFKEKGFVINEKALREFLNRKAPFSPNIWEAVLGKKTKEFF